MHANNLILFTHLAGVCIQRAMYCVYVGFLLIVSQVVCNSAPGLASPLSQSVPINNDGLQQVRKGAGMYFCVTSFVSFFFPPVCYIFHFVFQGFLFKLANSTYHKLCRAGAAVVHVHRLNIAICPAAQTLLFLSHSTDQGR